MRVLVTGHLGYIGTVLTPMLLERGHDVVGLDTDLFSRCTFGDASAIAIVPNCDCDVRDIAPEMLRGFDGVLHLAGLSNDPLGDFDPELTLAINHRASMRLATFAKNAGVTRFVYASSCSNYGASGDKLLKETAEFNPVTPYAVSKVLAERDIAPLCDSRFSPVFLRASTAYGVSPRIRFDLVMNNLVAWAHTTGRVFLKSDGSPWRPIVHVEDIARAYVAALEAPAARVAGQAFNVGRTDQNFRIRELATIVKRIVPVCEVAFALDAGPDKRCYRVNCDKINDALPDSRAVWDAERGARQLYSAYLANGLARDEFEGPTYQRLAHLRDLISIGVVGADLRPVRLASAVRN
jgi:nucleoside-diphosphate-sugar epimerase